MSANPWIVCAITGRRWPQSFRPWLQTCGKCGRLLDTWNGAWWEGPAGALCPVPCEKPAPESTEPVAAPRVVVPGVQAPLQEKLTGRQLLERNDWYKRNVLDKQD